MLLILLSRLVDIALLIVGYNILVPKFGMEVALAYVIALWILMPHIYKSTSLL